MRLILFIAAVFTLVVGGCFSDLSSVGKRCSPARPCPSELFCVTAAGAPNSTCEKSASDAPDGCIKDKDCDDGNPCSQNTCDSGQCVSDTQSLLATSCPLGDTSEGVCVAGDDGVPQCRAKNGAACAANGECGSKACVAGMCCDMPCPGECEACNSEGQCVATPECTDGRQRLTAGDVHACFLRDTLEPWCWGGNWSGQLGDSSEMNRSVPVQVSGLPTKATQLSAGEDHTCARLENRQAWCWGAQGLLGNAAATTSAAIAVGGDIAGRPVAMVSAGLEHTCVVLSAGTAWCWGADHSGQLGDSSALLDQVLPAPVSVANLGADRHFVTISAGEEHTCALLSDGSLWCWGGGESGQLGGATVTQLPLPVAVDLAPFGGVAVVDVVSASQHTCAVLADNSVWCWGDDSRGQLGDGDADSSAAGPKRVVLPTTARPLVDASRRLTCAAVADQLWCWGDLASDYDTSNIVKTPQRVAGDGSALFTAIGVGDAFACGLKQGGGADCWGSNWIHQLADGTGLDRPNLGSVVLDAAGLGEPCVDGTACASGLCVAAGVEKICLYEGAYCNIQLEHPEVPSIQVDYLSPTFEVQLYLDGEGTESWQGLGPRVTTDPAIEWTASASGCQARLTGDPPAVWTTDAWR